MLQCSTLHVQSWDCCQRTASWLRPMYLWGGVSLFFFFFCHRRMRRVLNIRSFWIIYLSYTFLCIHRENLDNYCGLSLKIIRFLWICARKEGWKERKEYSSWIIYYRFTFLVYEGKDFLIHSRPFTFFFPLEPFVCLWILWVSFWIVNFLPCMPIFLLLGRYILYHSLPLPDSLPCAYDPSGSICG